jgi:hypothetical protein
MTIPKIDKRAVRKNINALINKAKNHPDYKDNFHNNFQDIIQALDTISSAHKELANTINADLSTPEGRDTYFSALFANLPIKYMEEDSFLFISLEDDDEFILSGLCYLVFASGIQGAYVGLINGFLSALFAK